MLWLSNLKADSHLLVTTWHKLRHLFDILFDSKSVENVLIVFRLMAFAKLVAHDDSALGSLGLTSLQIWMVQRRSLQVVNSWVKYTVLKNLLKFFTGLSAPHYHDIGVHGSVIFMEALFEEILDCLILTVTKQKDMFRIVIRLQVADPAVLRGQTVYFWVFRELSLELNHDHHEENKEQSFHH